MKNGNDRYHCTFVSDGGGTITGIDRTGPPSPAPSVGLATRADRGRDWSRSWASERRNRSLAGRIHRTATAVERWRGWPTATAVGAAIGLILLIVGLAGAHGGCGGTAGRLSTDECVTRVVDCPVPDGAAGWGAWVQYSLCLAAGALPCVVGTVPGAQSGCPTLDQCVQKSECFSVVACQQAVTECFDECR